jgi:hypothetical protein
MALKKIYVMRLAAIGAGLAGSIVVTAIHQILKNTRDDAPRMDLLGVQSLAKITGVPFEEAKESSTAYYATMAADIVVNSMYYAIVGIGGKKKAIVSGAALGAAAGAGSFLLPGKLGLDADYSNRTPQTKAMAFGLYLVGGLIAGIIYRATAK